MPTPKQAAFLLANSEEVLFGGAAGPGKSSALLMAALQYVDQPHYAALLLRRTLRQLSLAGGLLDRARDWLLDTDAVWKDRESTWVFPSGAKLIFGYLEHENDKFRYQGPEFQFIGMDEGTQFAESQYTYMFSRLRRLRGTIVPVRMRMASNPGGPGHEWVRQRFLVEGRQTGRVFIPASLDDNPHLDVEAYEKSLAQLDPITRMQLRNGDWDVREQGGLFMREWFDGKYIPYPKNILRMVRYWDLAATTKHTSDFTAGVKIAKLDDGNYCILDVQRFKASPSLVEHRVRETAEADGYEVEIWMEQEPGSAGVSVIDHYRRNVLGGFTFYGNKETGAKSDRARGFSATCQGGNVFLVQYQTWLSNYLDELCVFPHGAHDDMVDASSGAFRKVSLIGGSGGIYV